MGKYFDEKNSKMPIYEVTAFVPLDVDEAWLEYMKSHMNDLIVTKCFSRATMHSVKSESYLVKNYVMSYHYEEDESFEGISKFKKSVTNRDGRNSFLKIENFLQK